MTVSPGDVIKAAAVMRGLDGQDIINVFHFRYDGAGSLTDTNAMLDLSDFLDDLYDLVDGRTDSTVTFVNVTGFNETTSQPLPVAQWPSLTVGGQAANGLPPGVAALVRLNTGINRVIGRKYLPPVTEADAAYGTWSSGYLTDLAAFGAFLIGGFLGSTSLQAWLPGVVSSVGAFWAFQEAVVSNNAAYQRRRRPGTGS